MKFITILTLLSALRLSSPQCNKFFPKILGSSDNDTTILDIDANQYSIYACGRTSSELLSGYQLTHNPYIAAFDIASTQLKWGFTDRA
jgi:hypothetical protein